MEKKYDANKILQDLIDEKESEYSRKSSSLETAKAELARLYLLRASSGDANQYLFAKYDEEITEKVKEVNGLYTEVKNRDVEIGHLREMKEDDEKFSKARALIDRLNSDD